VGKGGSYGSLFHDISTGNNTNSSSPNLFYAVSGYDLCTGLGTPKGQALISALVGSSSSAPLFLVSPLRLASANVSQPYAVNLSTNASDSNPADTLTFAKVTGPTWLGVAASGILSGTAAVSNVGTNTFTVRVTDSGGLSSTGTVFLTVNGAPSFSLNPFSMPTANAGQTYSATVASQVTDPNPGDTLSIRKVSGPAWMSVASSGALSGVPGQADAGTNVFVLSVTDSGGLSNSANMLVYVNAAPGFTQNPLLLPNASVGQAYSASLTNQATDPNSGDLLTFAKVSGPSWLGVAGRGLVSGTPASSDAGTNHFVVSVVDSGGLSNTAAMTVVVLPKPSPMTVRGSLLGNQLAISWTGGAGPFQLQIATNLAAAAWQD
ncbi:MAG: putative Ig domain-containing protein, partial [Limisphaerales bacterium]